MVNRDNHSRNTIAIRPNVKSPILFIRAAQQLSQKILGLALVFEKICVCPCHGQTSNTACYDISERTVFVNVETGRRIKRFSREDMQ
jgi:hypothetical protein